MPLVPALRDRIRSGLIARQQRSDPRLAPWPEAEETASAGFQRACLICGWHGPAFVGTAHCESAECRCCGSIARDRFMYRCFVKRVGYRPGLRVLETSPRLGARYRAVMGRRCRYVSSDFDRRGHLGDVALDLQRLGVRDTAFDVILTAHVLEHVPDTDAALAELRRSLSPGGTLLLSVPVLQGRTAPPDQPEFHGDNTPVFWRFGPDLTARLREHGFQTRMLVPAALAEEATNPQNRWPAPSPEFDAPAILGSLDPADLDVVADERTARRLGFDPGYMFLLWECVKR